jgi:FkbM family methyltransferase
MKADLLLRVRPAALASLLAAAFRLNKRRLVRGKHATLFINPVSNFGAAILKGEFEPQMREVLCRYLSPGGVFIDLGANEGYFSVLASQIVGPRGTVIAIEPQSRLQHVICTNLQVNDCFNVRLVRCVVSDRTGKAQLSLAPTVNTGSSSLFRPTKYLLPTEEVPSFCLSDLIDRLGIEHCDLMKVDIEGAEYDVLTAAPEVLRKGTFRHIALEVHNSILERRGLAAVDLHKHMAECGYELNTDFGDFRKAPSSATWHWIYSFGKKNALTR